MLKREANSTSAAPLAVLVSGGLDSAILLGEAIQQRPAVFPLYVRSGMAWESVEFEHLQRYLQALACPVLRPLHALELPVTDVYDREHWSLSGAGVPDAHTKDEAVFLPGRNVLLLSKALIWCHLRGVPELAMAPLGSNPFPDATPAFFASFVEVVNRAVDGDVRLWLPYASLHKAEVMQRGRGLPLEMTFSCIRPRGGRHCGECNKCAERRQAFADAGMQDPTPYAEAPPEP
ncbi:ExsB family transcriptional regulator [Planctomycetaceae bacterium SCGC AG-212-D15]|nr:ExsB family transcriptional regulator [Planctomycetaceae bacterium SCGC AG-212-D15]